MIEKLENRIFNSVTTVYESLVTDLAKKNHKFPSEATIFSQGNSSIKYCWTITDSKGKTYDVSGMLKANIKNGFTSFYFNIPTKTKGNFFTQVDVFCGKKEITSMGIPYTVE